MKFAMLQLLADDEASGRQRTERILGEHSDCRLPAESQPRYAQPLHDCELTFLGRHGEDDMYFCAKHQEYVARFGDAEEDYVSADVELVGVHRVLKHAVVMKG